MTRVKYLILGAGPSGLTLGRRLSDHKENDILIVEKESCAGGLCRSVIIDGAPLDIGGGHFLDVKDETVCGFLFEYLGKDEWNLFDRDSRIRIFDMEISHPFEANLWQFSEDIQNGYLESIKNAGCNTGAEMPEKFTDWIRWKLGDRIADDYMLPYNRKIFADELNELGTYWLNKLPNVSYEDTLRSCREKKSFGTQPGHARFYYPKKYGYGEVFTRIADSMHDKVIYDNRVISLNMDEKRVTLSDGTVIEAEVIITTIPWTSFDIEGCPVAIRKLTKKLKSSAVEIRYVPEDPKTEAHWVYIPDEKIPYHRILCRKNFAPESRGYWLETRKERTDLYSDGKYKDGYHYLNDYAYPLNTLDKPQDIGKILDHSAECGIYGLGRWGEHEHYNSDVVIRRALEFADRLIK